MSGRPVTRDDVARRAGVSTAVVSYVLNGGPRPVSAERRERVVSAIAELGYRRDAVAAALSSRRSRTLGLLLPDAANPFFADLARRIEDAAFARGLTVLIGNAAEDREREARHLEAFLAHRVDGVIAILADVAAPLPAQLDALADRVVLVDRVPAAWSGRSVAVDNRLGGRLAAERLIALGRRRLTLVAGPAGFAHVRDRVEGFQAALPGDATCTTVAASAFEFVAGRAAMAAALASLRPDGVFCCTDSLAIGALAALAEVGRPGTHPREGVTDVTDVTPLRVPHDVAVIGYDDVAQAAVAVPPLTTIAQPIDEMAETALALLLDGRTGSIVLPPRLVVRESG